jgi:hypothetical protein
LASTTVYRVAFRPFARAGFAFAAAARRAASIASALHRFNSSESS